MPSETITSTVAAFLKAHQPFNKLLADELTMLCKEAEIIHLPKDEFLFKQGDPPQNFFFVVRKGSVALTHQTSVGNVLLDLCDEGDVFGVRVFFAGDHYKTNASAKEESLIYALPIAPAKELLQKNPQLAFFFASVFATNLPQRAEKVASGLEEQSEKYVGETAAATDFKIVSPVTNVITCSPETTVQQAAATMTKYSIGSMIIANSTHWPLGIVTDSDLRKRVLSKNLDASTTVVNDIMSSPVFTIKQEQRLAMLVMKMIEHSVGHFCITEDGTPNSPIVGVISERDILTSQGNNPAVIAKKVRSAKSKDELPGLRDKAEEIVSQYLNQEVPIAYISEIITRINDALIKKICTFSEEEMVEEGHKPPKEKYCWLSLGSEGRMEQLLRSDQDNALIYQNPAENEAESVKAYYLALGKKITDQLIACGYEKCPADMMGSNPKWCQPYSQWKKYFQEWVGSPQPKALLNANIFFDFRPVYGEAELAHSLKDEIFQMMDKSSIFKMQLAHNALLNPPPLSFFRNFIVEKEGEYTDRFDIKKRALMPLTDAARVLAYDFKLTTYDSTFARYEKIAEANPNLSKLCQEAAFGYKTLMEFRAKEGLRTNSSGKFIDTERLNKLERQNLKNVFVTIGKVQKILRTRFQTDYIRM